MTNVRHFNNNLINLMLLELSDYIKAPALS